MLTAAPASLTHPRQVFHKAHLSHPLQKHSFHAAQHPDLLRPQRFASGRLKQEEELNLKPERLLTMRWVLTWKYTEGGDRKAKARLVILEYQHPELTSVPTAAPTLGKMSRHL